MKKILPILFLLFSSHSFAISPIYVNSSAGNTSICIGAQTFFIDSTSGGIWSISDTLIAKINTLGTAIGISTGIVTITYSMDTGYVTKTVAVYPLPSPIFGPTYICLDGFITVYDTTAGGGLWEVISAGTVSLYYETPNFIIIQGGNGGGGVIFVDTSGCSTSIDVMDIGYPMPPIEGDTVIYVDSSTTLYGAGPGGTWSSDDTTIAKINLTTGLITGISPGTTRITYTLGCLEIGTLTVLPPSGISIQSNMNGNEIAIYPNPTTTAITISGAITINQVIITNLLGQVVYNHDYDIEHVKIDVTDLPTGIYFIKINNIEVRKFLKE